MSTASKTQRHADPLKVYVADVHTGSKADLEGLVRYLEDLQVTGFLMGDHLFMSSRAGDSGEGTPQPAGDPFTTLAAVGAMSDRMELGTLVANVGFGHPVHILRHFAQLATLYGGERVLAGIGAGWNREEFEALGHPMPPLSARVDHLESSAQFARGWFDSGVADIESATVVARGLPMSPRPLEAPRLLLGGGSRRVLELAGRYADHVDLHPLVSREHARREGGLDDVARFLATTLDDAEAAVELLEVSERSAGREVGATRRSMWMALMDFCDDADRREAEEAMCLAHGLSWRDLSQCPYALVGDPTLIAALVRERRERLGLDAVVMQPGRNLERFMSEVVPLL